MLSTQRRFHILLIAALLVFAGQVAAQAQPSLSIPDEVAGTPGEVVAVDVSFDPGAATVTAIAFSVDYDETILSYDGSTPFTCLVIGADCTLQPLDGDVDGELDFTIISADPLVGIAAQVVVSIPFLVDAAASPAQIAAIDFSVTPIASYGNDVGASQPGDTPDNGSIIIIAANLTATYSIQGRTDANLEVPIAVRIYDQANVLLDKQILGGTGVDASTAQVAPEGLAPGTYLIGLKFDNTLQNVREVTITTGAQTVDFGELRVGDFNDDNIITVADFSQFFFPALNTADTDPAYNILADFNLDGIVSVADFSQFFFPNLNTGGDLPFVAGN